MTDVRSVVEWLVDGARSAPTPQDVLAELCTRLNACGLPLWRVAMFVLGEIMKEPFDPFGPGPHFCPGAALARRRPGCASTGEGAQLRRGAH